MSKGNSQFVLHNESISEVASMLTEYAQIQRVMRNHERAEKAETIRNTIYAQHGDKL